MINQAFFNQTYLSNMFKISLNSSSETSRLDSVSSAPESKQRERHELKNFFHQFSTGIRDRSKEYFRTKTIVSRTF